jgi:hypothetical protein
MTSLAALAVASPAFAAPKGPYAVFSDCPTNTPEHSLCVFGEFTEGEFKIGKTTVPINKKITLQAGAAPRGDLSFNLVAAKDGNTLSKTELEVPGGLLGLMTCSEIKGEGAAEKAAREACKSVVESKLLALTLTPELVATEKNPAIINLNSFFSLSGSALTLPIRFHLNNPLLGSACYIGSAANPIQLHLTTGTTSPPPPNKPISGRDGLISEEEEVLVFNFIQLVDNSFAVPVAEGCGGAFAPVLDPIIDARLGLPSAAGHNTAILGGTLRITSVEAVVASEK